MGRMHGVHGLPTGMWGCCRSIGGRSSPLPCWNQYGTNDAEKENDRGVLRLSFHQWETVCVSTNLLQPISLVLRGYTIYTREKYTETHHESAERFCEHLCYLNPTMEICLQQVNEAVGSLIFASPQLLSVRSDRSNHCHTPHLRDSRFPLNTGMAVARCYSFCHSGILKG